MLDVIKTRINANCTINIINKSYIFFTFIIFLTTRSKKILEQANFSVLWVPGAGTVTMTTPNTERVA